MMSDEERVTHFPVKLWDVVDDESNNIFTWSGDGESFFVDDVCYENEIMEKYPGFVQISSFANLRRLLREYSFTWKNNDAGEFEFSHPGFSKGVREKLHLIKTKRKSANCNPGLPKMRRRPTGSDGRSNNNSKNNTKSWVQPISTGSVRLRMETLMRFPEKFWAVVNDPNDLLYWGDGGVSVIVDDKKFEEEIMNRYPGFVQINSFANLRRLLREYGFSWSIRDNGFFEFSHPNMRRDRPDLVSGVKTKRKALKAGAPHPYLPFYRIDSSIHSHMVTGDMNKNFAQGTYEGCDQHSLRDSTSPAEVSQAIGAIQQTNNAANNEIFINHNAADSIRRGLHHGLATGDHASHHPFYNPATHLTATSFPRYLPYNTSNIPSGSQSASNHNYWSVQGSGDKIESPFYYWQDNAPPCSTPSERRDTVGRLELPDESSEHGHVASLNPSSEAIFPDDVSSSKETDMNDDGSNSAPITEPQRMVAQHIPGPEFNSMYMMNQQQPFSISHPFYEPSIYQPVYHPSSGQPYQTASCHQNLPYKDDASLDDADFDSLSMTSPPTVQLNHPSSGSSPLDVVNESIKIEEEENNNEVDDIAVALAVNCQQAHNSTANNTINFFPKSMKVMNML